MPDDQLSFDRYCWQCSHALRGVVSNVCPECGRPFDPQNPRTTLSSPRFARSLREVFLILTTFCTVTTALLLIASASGFVFADPLGFLGPAGFVACGLPLSPFFLVLLVLAARSSVPVGRRLRVFSIAVLILLVSIFTTNWPFRVSLALHKPSLNKIANEVQRTGQTKSPGFIGIIHCREVRLHSDGPVGFQLSGGAGGGVYLVRCKPPDHLAGTGRYPIWYNMNWEEHLGDDWWLAYED